MVNFFWCDSAGFQRNQRHPVPAEGNREKRDEHLRTAARSPSQEHPLTRTAKQAVIRLSDSILSAKEPPHEPSPSGHLDGMSVFAEPLSLSRKTEVIMRLNDAVWPGVWTDRWRQCRGYAAGRWSACDMGSEQSRWSGDQQGNPLAFNPIGEITCPPALLRRFRNALMPWWAATPRVKGPHPRKVDLRRQTSAWPVKRPDPPSPKPAKAPEAWMPWTLCWPASKASTITRPQKPGASLRLTRPLHRHREAPSMRATFMA